MRNKSAQIAYYVGMDIVSFATKIVAGVISSVGLLFSPVTYTAPVPTAVQHVATSTKTAQMNNTKTQVIPSSMVVSKSAAHTVRVAQLQGKSKTLSPIVHPALTTSIKANQTASNVSGNTVSSVGQLVVAGKSQAISPNILNEQTRAALVNIICTIQSSGSINPISGSGVIIDSRGIILTNAHVAQFFLLRDYPGKDNVQCVVRVGSPARAMYTAELLYLPTAWVDANASQITSSAPTGTGENDFAFLRITGTTNPNGSMPPEFPHLPMNIGDPQPQDQMLLAAYPAGFLEGANILTNLYQTSAYATVGAVYVFNSSDTWIDLFSIPGSMVSQSGSSGGAAVRTDTGALTGIITTDTSATTTAGRDLRAVSLDHVEHSLSVVGLGGMLGLLSGDVKAKSAQFNTTVAPVLAQKLIKFLK